MVEQVFYLGRLDKLANKESFKRLALELGSLSGIIPLDGKGEDAIVEWAKRYELRMVVKRRLEKLGILEALRSLENNRRRYRFEEVGRD